MLKSCLNWNMNLLQRIGLPDPVKLGGVEEPISDVANPHLDDVYKLNFNLWGKFGSF